MGIEHTKAADQAQSGPPKQTLYKSGWYPAWLGEKRAQSPTNEWVEVTGKMPLAYRRWYRYYQRWIDGQAQFKRERRNDRKS